jgi:hypothetical protein
MLERLGIGGRERDAAVEAGREIVAVDMMLTTDSDAALRTLGRLLRPLFVGVEGWLGEGRMLLLAVRAAVVMAADPSELAASLWNCPAASKWSSRLVEEP